jgi:hypothetical protein
LASKGRTKDVEAGTRVSEDEDESERREKTDNATASGIRTERLNILSRKRRKKTSCISQPVWIP